MAKVEFTAAVSSVRGKVRGGIFRGGRAGGVLMEDYSPRSRSANQVAQRCLVSDFSDEWYALTEAQRELWEKYASMLKPALTGHGAYMKLNLRLAAANHVDLVALTEPPETPSTPMAFVGVSLVWM